MTTTYHAYARDWSLTGVSLNYWVDEPKYRVQKARKAESSISNYFGPRDWYILWNQLWIHHFQFSFDDCLLIYLLMFSPIWLFMYPIIHLTTSSSYHSKIHFLNYWYIHHSIHWFLFSFVYSIIHLFNYSIIHLFIHTPFHFIYSCASLLIIYNCSFIYLIIWLYNLSFIYSCIHSFVHLFIKSFV